MGRKKSFTKSDECPHAISKDDPFFGLRLDDDQLNFVNAMLDPSVIFCGLNAKAGTGKTLLSVAVGYMLVQYGMYDGIVYITAPVQEEKLGYMPGDLQMKIAMYMEPLYEALVKLGLSPYQCISQLSQDGAEGQKNGGFIDATTHVFMRGINLSRKFVILDEAQNFKTCELQKVFTRCHDDSKVVAIGHSGQIDLVRNPDASGFEKYLQLFKNDSFARICKLEKNYRGVFATRADQIGQYL